MVSISAIIRAKAGKEAIVRDALAAVAAHVAVNEPDTVGYFVSQSMADPCVFTTYERFADQAAMELHNNSPAVAKFIADTEGALDGDVVLHASHELSAK
jgi:quinol monooxygenase YgiN